MTIDWWIEAIEYSLTTGDLSSFVLSDRVQKHLAAPPVEILSYRKHKSFSIYNYKAIPLKST